MAGKHVAVRPRRRAKAHKARAPRKGQLAAAVVVGSVLTLGMAAGANAAEIPVNGDNHGSATSQEQTGTTAAAIDITAEDPVTPSPVDPISPSPVVPVNPVTPAPVEPTPVDPVNPAPVEPTPVTPVTQVPAAPVSAAAPAPAVSGQAVRSVAAPGTGFAGSGSGVLPGSQAKASVPAPVSGKLIAPVANTGEVTAEQGPNVGLIVAGGALASLAGVSMAGLGGATGRSRASAA